MRINGRTLAYEKSPESPREMWAPDASRMERQFVIAGDAKSRIEAAWDFLGGSRLNGPVTIAGKAQYYITRTLPHAYPYTTDAGTTADAEKSFLYAQSIPAGSPIGVGRPDTSYPVATAYDRYLITVSYQTLSYSALPDTAVLAVDGPLQGYPDEGNVLAHAPAIGPGVKAFSAGRYISRVARPGTRFEMLRAGVLRFADGTPTGTGIPESIGVPRPFQVLTYRWHMVPFGGYPAKAIEQALGALNTATFDGYAAQTLLLTAAVGSRTYRDPFGQKVVDVDYTFRYEPKVSPVTGIPMGQNAYFRALNGAWDYVPARTNGLSWGQGPFRLVDFSTLFRPDTN